MVHSDVMFPINLIGTKFSARSNAMVVKRKADTIIG